MIVFNPPIKADFLNTGPCALFPNGRHIQSKYANVTVLSNTDRYWGREGVHLRTVVPSVHPP